jgi:hypothetical protein
MHLRKGVIALFQVRFDLVPAESLVHDNRIQVPPSVARRRHSSFREDK